MELQPEDGQLGESLGSTILDYKNFLPNPNYILKNKSLMQDEKNNVSFEDKLSMQDLEKLKLSLEIQQIKKPWYKKPEWWPPIAAIVAIVGGLSAGFFSKENLIQQISKLRDTKDSIIQQKKRVSDSLINIQRRYNETSKSVNLLTNDTIMLNGRIKLYTAALAVKDSALAKNKFLEKITKHIADLEDKNMQLSAQLQLYQNNPLLISKLNVGTSYDDSQLKDINGNPLKDYLNLGNITSTPPSLQLISDSSYLLFPQNPHNKNKTLQELLDSKN